MNHRIVTEEIIAEEFHKTTHFVHLALSASRKDVGAITIQGRIRRYALEHGATMDENGKITLSYLTNSNFQTKDDRNDRMLVLRSQGYTNQEIAEKIGCSLDTVNRFIGLQPESFTDISTDYAARIRVLQIEARKKRAEAYKQDMIKAKIAEMERKLKDDIIQFEQMKNQIEAKRKEIEEAKASLSA